MQLPAPDDVPSCRAKMAARALSFRALPSRGRRDLGSSSFGPVWRYLVNPALPHCSLKKCPAIFWRFCLRFQRRTYQILSQALASNRNKLAILRRGDPTN